MPFGRKLVIAFAVAIGLPLVGYAGLMQLLNQSRLTQIDQVALEERLSAAENQLREMGAQLARATGRCATSGGPWPSLAAGHGGAVAALVAAADAAGADAACLVRPGGDGAGVALGRNLPLDGAISASAVVGGVAAASPSWTTMPFAGDLVIVAAARTPATPANGPLLVMARRFAAGDLARMMGDPGCRVAVEPIAAHPGAHTPTGGKAASHGFISTATRVANEGRAIHATHRLTGAGAQGAALSAFADRSSLPGRGPRFATIATCAFGCALLLAALLTSMVSAWVARPVDDLRRGMEALARGERIRQPLEVTTDDALGRMTAAFNGMLASLDDAQRILLHNERLVIAGKMSSAVAHEVRNVLTPLQLRVDMLLQIAADRAIRDSLAGMKQEISRGANLLRNLLDLARSGPDDPSPVSADDLVARAADLVRPYARKLGVTLHQGDVTGGALIMGDRSQLLQALVNLINNACESGARNVTIGASVADGSVQLRVRDDGTGMDGETARRALEPFYTTKPEGQGTGLGLSICQMAAKMHGGSLALDSSPGIGTRALLSLPVSGGEVCSLSCS